MSSKVPTDTEEEGESEAEAARPDLTPLPADHWDTVFDSAPELSRAGTFFGRIVADLLACRELA